MKLISVVIAALCLAGCSKNIDTKEAVRAAIEKRVVKTGFDLQSMAVNVTSVSFHGNKAEATASFVPKGSNGSGSVAFNYNLERQKDEWVVTSLQQGSMAGHPGVGGPAGGAPGAPGTTPPASGVPIDPSRPLPPGHPSVGSKP